MYLSIIIPMYNRETTIERCLDSILNQKMKGVEIICVDDASTDRTRELVEKYRMKYDNISLVINEKNRGLSYSRNRGMEHARGEYIWFVDSDDYICKGSLQWMQEYILSNPIDVICFDALKINDMGETLVTSEINCIGQIMTGEELFCAFSEAGAMRSPVCFKIYAKDFLKKTNIRFTEGYISEDAFFTLQALVNAETAVYVPECFYVYQMSSVSITTSSKNVDKFKGSFIAFCDMWNFWYSKKWNQRVSEYMIQYILVYRRIVAEVYQEENEEIREWIAEQNDFIQKLFFYLKQDNFNQYYIRDINQANRLKLEQAEEVYVYGTGAVAKELLPILNKMEKRILAYLLSDSIQRCDRKVIYGVPVVKISELKEKKKDALVVIATLPRHYQAIEETLRKNGFNNFIKIMEQD